jgi:hypothetical protein
LTAGKALSGSGTEVLTFESFGLGVRLELSGVGEPELVQPLLPPGSQPCSAERVDASFSLRASAGSTFELRRDDDSLAEEVELERALEILERELRAVVALKAPGYIFVHAGVVGHGGAAVLIPGSSYAGKTSLVAALVRAGAHYYSDEFAPLDPSGLVHPFQKPLSIRDERYVQVDHHVDVLGGIAGDGPLPVGVVVLTSYESGAAWRPRRLSHGEAVLGLMAHTVPAQSRPAQTLRTIRRSLEAATVIEGSRGEADVVAPLLLDELERAR